MWAASDWRLVVSSCKLVREAREFAWRLRGFQYSLYYGSGGERIIGYDNEAGKGDHRHYRGRQEAYRFSNYEALIREFMNDVLRERAQ